MVHHIVMWKFKPEIEEGQKPELKKAMAENLAALVGKVPGLLTVEFVENPISSSTHDIALVTTLEKAEDIGENALEKGLDCAEAIANGEDPKEAAKKVHRKRKTKKNNKKK